EELDDEPSTGVKSPRPQAPDAAQEMDEPSTGVRTPRPPASEAAEPIEDESTGGDEQTQVARPNHLAGRLMPLVGSLPPVPKPEPSADGLTTTRAVAGGRRPLQEKT